MELNRKVSRKNFDGSDKLFNACWQQYRRYLSSVNYPECQEDVDNWLYSIASEKVNNSRSVFYITG